MSMSGGNAQSFDSGWFQPGKSGSNNRFPGSYGKYFKLRDRPGSYKETKQQKGISKIGKRVGENCKGKGKKDGGSSEEFARCVSKQAYLVGSDNSWTPKGENSPTEEQQKTHEENQKKYFPDEAAA